jgi:hypothetical protein
MAPGRWRRSRLYRKLNYETMAVVKGGIAPALSPSINLSRGSPVLSCRITESPSLAGQPESEFHTSDLPTLRRLITNTEETAAAPCGVRSDVRCKPLVDGCVPEGIQLIDTGDTVIQNR